MPERPKWNVVPKRLSDAAKPQLTIHPDGRCHLSRPAYDGLGRPARVELVEDMGRRMIGFRASADGGEAHKVTVGRDPGGVVSALRGLRRLDLVPTRALRYEAEILDGVLVVRLDQEPVDASKNGRTK